jgi:peptidoglycan hydrolase-like protein with peptidoglycan-binding domain
MAIRTLSAGMNGPDVKAIQEALNVWGANPRLIPDGKFQSKTDTAVRVFQQNHGLKVDGAVGRGTRAALFPLGVATLTLYGMRLRIPEPPRFRGGTDPFRLPPLSLNPPRQVPIADFLSRPSYEPVRFLPLTTMVAAPRIPEFTITVPVTPSAPPSQPFGFVYDHAELQPGGQTTFPFNGSRQDAFVLTMQNVYRRGPDDGAHQELDLGVQIGTPFSSPNGPWTVNPFIQLTDVDRFGALGKFHYWQPYAQAGFQFMGLGNPRPALTANLFPLNFGLDIGDLLTVNLAGGMALTMDLGSGRVQVGPQFTAGITVKLGKPNSPLF